MPIKSENRTFVQAMGYNSTMIYVIIHEDIRPRSDCVGQTRAHLGGLRATSWLRGGKLRKRGLHVRKVRHKVEPTHKVASGGKPLHLHQALTIGCADGSHMIRCTSRCCCHKCVCGERDGTHGAASLIVVLMLQS